MCRRVLLAPQPESTFRHIAPAPIAQRSKNGAEALAALGQLVLEPWRVLAVQTTGDESLTFHRLEARGERVRRHASQRLLQVLEAPWPLQQQIAQDEDRSTARRSGRAFSRPGSLDRRSLAHLETSRLTSTLQVTTIFIVTSLSQAISRRRAMKISTRWLLAGTLSGVVLTAVALGNDRPAPLARSNRPELEYLKVVNRAGPPREPPTALSADGPVRERQSATRRRRVSGFIDATIHPAALRYPKGPLLERNGAATCASGADSAVPEPHFVGQGHGDDARGGEETVRRRGFRRALDLGSGQGATTRLLRTAQRGSTPTCNGASNTLTRRLTPGGCARSTTTLQCCTRPAATPALQRNT